jgi:hypothetical protein
VHRLAEHHRQPDASLGNAQTDRWLIETKNLNLANTMIRLSVYVNAEVRDDAVQKGAPVSNSMKNK